MADKLTPKQEGFARSYVELSNAAEAYRLHYKAEKMSPEAIAVEACRLKADPKVALMIGELQKEHAKRHEVTVDTLTKLLNEAITLAKQEGQSATIVSAVKEMGTIHGVRIEKSEHKLTHESALDLMDDDPLD